MTQMHAHPALSASLDDKCFTFGRVIGGLKVLGMLNSALARATAASTDIIYPAHAVLAPALHGNAGR